MEVYVDQDECIACGLCMEVCPEMFEWNKDQSKATAKKDVVPDDLVNCAQEAADGCPTEAIKTQ